MYNQFYLMDLERTIITGLATYWKPNKFGYTTILGEAGIYSEEEADQIVSDDFDKRTVAINLHIVDNILK
ncbi:hypothetical protein [Virgibacillus sp. CBA3643]|uniref:hypothetical protein n=1 Tax=Virgibacillus sp. CBA3643 TaxID=2942278 RepID=UPI0035A36AC4